MPLAEARLLAIEDVRSRWVVLIVRGSLGGWMVVSVVMGLLVFSCVRGVAAMAVMGVAPEDEMVSEVGFS